MGLIPGWGAKILHAAGVDKTIFFNKKFKNENENNLDTF